MEDLSEYRKMVGFLLTMALRLGPHPLCLSKMQTVDALLDQDTLTWSMTLIEQIFLLFEAQQNNVHTPHLQDA